MLDEFLGGEARDAGRAGKGKAGLRGVGKGRTGLWGGRQRGLILFREVNE